MIAIGVQGIEECFGFLSYVLSYLFPVMESSAVEETDTGYTW